MTFFAICAFVWLTLNPLEAQAQGGGGVQLQLKDCGKEAPVLVFPGAHLPKENISSVYSIRSTVHELVGGQTTVFPIYGMKDIQLKSLGCKPLAYIGNLPHAIKIYGKNMVVIAFSSNDNEGAIVVPSDSPVKRVEDLGELGYLYAVPDSITATMVAGHTFENELKGKRTKLMPIADQSRALTALAKSDSGTYPDFLNLSVKIGENDPHPLNTGVIARRTVAEKINAEFKKAGKPEPLRIFTNPAEFTGPGPAIYVASTLSPVERKTILEKALNLSPEGLKHLGVLGKFVESSPNFSKQLKHAQEHLLQVDLLFERNTR